MDMRCASAAGKVILSNAGCKVIFMAVVRLFFLGGFLVSAHVGCRCTTADLFKSAPLPQGVHPGVCTMDIHCASTVVHCLVVGIL